MPLINGQKYPDTYLEVSKDSVLRPLFLRQIKRDGDLAKLAILKVPANFDPREYYATFFAPKTAQPLYHFPKITKVARSLARIDGWHLIMEWKKLHRAAITQSMISLNSETLPKIYRTKTFRHHHFAKVRKGIKIPPRLITTLDIRNKSALMDMVAALKVGDRKAAETFGRQALEKKSCENPGELFDRILREIL